MEKPVVNRYKKAKRNDKPKLKKKKAETNYSNHIKCRNAVGFKYLSKLG